MVAQWQRFFYHRRYSAVKLAQPDFVKLAQKIRDDGITITTLGVGSDYNDALLTEM
jgi:thiamine pyrophosphate-dependent acetolactate synthase large subunit-like protein